MPPRTSRRAGRSGNGYKTGRRAPAPPKGRARGRRNYVHKKKTAPSFSSVFADKSRPRPSKDTISEKYDVGKTIGEGTFGKVKKGMHKLTGITVAIKILEKDRIIDAADIERVRREIAILRTVSHPNVIKLYEVLDSPRHLYLIMNYAPGGELFDYIVEKGRVEERKACKYFHQILNGVNYCHKMKVIHRDLKPENLLIGHNDSIQIVDFGLGNLVPNGQLLKTACGSPCYAAPEMIAGKKYYGEKADMWSLGVILFALVCGYLPFDDPNTSKLYDKIMHGRYELPDFISKSVADLIKKLLQTNPKKRFTAEQVRGHHWYCNLEVETDPMPYGGFDPLNESQHLIREDVLRHLALLGYDTEAVVRSVTASAHDDLYATYQLLCEKRKLMSTNAQVPQEPDARTPAKTKTVKPQPHHDPPVEEVVRKEVQQRQAAPPSSASTQQKPFNGATAVRPVVVAAVPRDIALPMQPSPTKTTNGQTIVTPIKPQTGIRAKIITPVGHNQHHKVNTFLVSPVKHRTTATNKTTTTTATTTTATTAPAPVSPMTTSTGYPGIPAAYRVTDLKVPRAPKPPTRPAATNSTVVRGYQGRAVRNAFVEKKQPLNATIQGKIPNPPTRPMPPQQQQQQQQQQQPQPPRQERYANYPLSPERKVRQPELYGGYASQGIRDVGADAQFPLSPRFRQPIQARYRMQYDTTGVEASAFEQKRAAVPRSARTRKPRVGSGGYRRSTQKSTASSKYPRTARVHRTRARTKQPTSSRYTASSKYSSQSSRRRSAKTSARRPRTSGTFNISKPTAQSFNYVMKDVRRVMNLYPNIKVNKVPSKSNPARSSLECIDRTRSDQLSFQIQIISQTKADRRYNIVRMRRYEGDSSAFKSICAAVIGKLKI